MSNIQFIISIHMMLTNFKPGTSIFQHIREMLFQTIIRSCFYCDPNAFGVRSLWISNSFFNWFTLMTWKGVVKISDKVIFVIIRKAHECAPHNNEFNLKTHWITFENFIVNFVAYTLSTECPNCFNCSTLCFVWR